eukprot:1539380-Pyramimonas_sp.AAC.1
MIRDVRSGSPSGPPLWAVLGPPGPSWGFLGLSWGPLGSFWSPLGGLLACLGAIFAAYRAVWDLVNHVSPGNGTIVAAGSWGASWGLLGAS